MVLISDDGGRLIPFPQKTAESEPPAPGKDVEPAPEVLEGELLSEEESAAVDARMRGAGRVTQVAQRVVALVVMVGESERTSATLGRTSLRVAVTVVQGFGSWRRRAWDASTMGVFRRAIRTAEASGNQELLAEWLDRQQKARERRHRRLMDLPKLAIGLVKAFAGGLVALVAFVLFLGLVAWMSGAGTVTGVVASVLTVARWVGIAIAVTWTPLLVLTPVFVLVGAWREGRRAAAPPQWLLSPQERAEATSEITPDLIAAALMSMRIPALTNYLKSGGTLEFLVPPREQGGGTYMQIRLPMGCAAAELWATPARVELLAGNLGRHVHEVWPQRQPQADARVLDLWVADKGTMDKPAPPWPLLLDGAFDVFRDRLPWGVTMRAEQVAVGMLQKHWLVGATSNQGKTTVVRLLALGLALDVTVELHIADLKGDGDWSMFAPRAVTLIEGSSDEKAAATVDMLERGVREVERRYEAKQAAGIVGNIPRELSRQPGSGFHPIWLFVDECQVMYGAPHPIGGSKDDARGWRAAKKLHDQARAVNVHLVQATQRPDDRTLPARVREGAHVRCALNVPNIEAARMILADAAERGARPQDLRPTLDAGTLVATGAVEDIPKGQAFAIVRTHYVPTKNAYAVIARAMELMRRAGRAVGAVAEELAASTDHLANIAKVMGDEKRSRTHAVLKRLSELDPLEYEGWTFADLKAALTKEGITARKVGGGVMHIEAEDVRRALAERDDAEGEHDDLDPYA